MYLRIVVRHRLLFPSLWFNVFCSDRATGLSGFSQYFTGDCTLIEAELLPELLIPGYVSGYFNV